MTTTTVRPQDTAPEVVARGAQRVNPRKLAGYMFCASGLRQWMAGSWVCFGAGIGLGLGHGLFACLGACA